jgi:hypothetical protein
VKSSSNRWVSAAVPVLPLVLFLGCTVETDGGKADDDTTGAVELTVHPEFVQGLLPGRRPLAIVEVGGEGPAVVVEATGALAGSTEPVPVSVDPAEVAPGEVAEVWVEAPSVSEESTLTVTITGRRGGAERTATVDTWIVPGTDDLGPTATEVAAVFLEALAGTVDGLPASRDQLVGGTTVASRLLVVSHYAWFTDESEIGLAWHIMIPPDDWAELYVRPRGQPAPSRAFRLSSWSTAVAGGEVKIAEIPPPAEVTR